MKPKLKRKKNGSFFSFLNVSMVFSLKICLKILLMLLIIYFDPKLHFIYISFHEFKIKVKAVKKTIQKRKIS